MVKVEIACDLQETALNQTMHSSGIRRRHCLGSPQQSRIFPGEHMIWVAEGRNVAVLALLSDFRFGILIPRRETVFKMQARELPFFLCFCLPGN